MRASWRQRGEVRGLDDDDPAAPTERRLSILRRNPTGDTVVFEGLVVAGSRGRVGRRMTFEDLVRHVHPLWPEEPQG